MIDLFGHEIFPGFQALTWKEPFATLMLCNKIETRSWNTTYRGKVLICMGLSEYSQAELLMMCGPSIAETIVPLVNQYPQRDLLRGHAFAIADLVNTRPMKKEDEGRCFVRYDFRLICHEYANVQRIMPFPFKGMQSWTPLTKEALLKVEII